MGQFLPDHAEKIGPALAFVVGAQLRFDMLQATCQLAGAQHGAGVGFGGGRRDIDGADGGDDLERRKRLC